MARSITTRRPLWVEEVDFGDGTHGYATDGTPVDCVRLATLGLVEGFEAELDRLGHQPRLEPRRRHHVLGHRRGGAGGRRARAAGDRRLPAVARARDGLPPRPRFDFDDGARFVARVVEEIDDVPLPPGTLLNVNVPGGRADRRRGLPPRQAHLPRRAEAHDEERPARRAATGSTAPTPASRTSRAPTWRRSPPGASPSRRCTST